MLSLDQQESYRRCYAEMNAGWEPSSRVYEDLVGARLARDACVLDLGCGRGGVMERLHPRVGQVVGLDPDWQSLHEHRAPTPDLSCGFAEMMPYADGAFDLVCCSWVLEHLAQPERVFREVSRVLKHEGRFVFLTPNLLHPLLRLNRVLSWTQGRLVDLFYDRSDPDIFPAFYRANSPGRIEQLASRAGLRRVSMRVVEDPTYLAFNETLFRLTCLLESTMPHWMGVHLVGEYCLIAS